jgi:GTP-binding protein HflX
LKIIQKRGRPSAKTFLGEGKAEELSHLVQNYGADMVIINDFLKPNQSNNLVNIIPCEVLDRFELILLIFEKHATSPEAKLQIELMRLKYEFPKLFGMGAHMAQQRGGTRSVGGSGEKLLENKRRHLKSRIKALEEKVEQFRGVRQNQRARRRRENLFTVSLVGYTNSGKSTLLRALTKKENILVENKLFSTLDTRLALMAQDSSYREELHNKILISDTIGFIRNLPPILFETFMATLEEVKEADLLIHVIDVSDSMIEEKIRTVEEILTQMQCHEKPRILVFNKADLVPHAQKLADVVVRYGGDRPFIISALAKDTLHAVKEEVYSRLHLV